MSRRFVGAIRDDIYYAAEGRCSNCGTALGADWHADHKIAWAKGGSTVSSNGQALCPPCNLRKGSSSMYSDAFKPRRFQEDVITAVLDGYNFGRRPVTMVLASPGSGKTLAYQAAATQLYREGSAALLAVYTPRLALAHQCETGWMWQDSAGDLHGEHQMFDANCRMGKIQHVPNRAPLTPLGVEGRGFVSTFSSLTTKPDLHLEWARMNEGQFLLVADEAQFCGTDGEREGGGTQAGARMQALSRYAAHTLLLTGTPYRSDDRPLILSDYSEPDDQGNRKLITHAEATYADGIADEYLRLFEATLDIVKVKWKGEKEYDLSSDGSYLMEILRRPEVWQPIVDETVAAVMERKLMYDDYRALIMCMEKQDAIRVVRYLRDRHPRLRVDIAISDHEEDAEEALRNFKVQSRDILVTVRKAFIGYNCPEITVVGLLTHYRHFGFLDQGVGRGLRVIPGIPYAEQMCRIIAPDDPKMVAFIEYLRTQEQQGLRRRAEREASEGSKDGAGVDRDLRELESAQSAGWRALSNDTDVPPEQLRLLRAAKEKFSLTDSDTKLAQFANFFTGLAQVLPATPPLIEEVKPTELPRTEQEQIDAVNAVVAQQVKQHMSDLGVYPNDRETYGVTVGRFTNEVNRRAGVANAKSVRTVIEAQARLAAVRALREEAAPQA